MGFKPDRSRPWSLYQDVMSALLVLVGLYWFGASFFLAKRSLPHVSDCSEGHGLLRQQLGLTAEEIAVLQRQATVFATTDVPRTGCWMERKVDSIIMLLVDALRFDFAYYNLPHSVGRRLHDAEHPSENKQTVGSSRLFQFIADPPTVTMQRLKALTTGGLPTFADISANFGGATVEDDSWIRLLNDTDWKLRGLRSSAKTGFVGDDTWDDLFPNYFTESYPYPSFNTRDLDTVDNGCLKHIPALLQKIRTTGVSPDELEVIVVHFLGVDHVGHTYGPHNEHMDAKMNEMDAALTTVLELLDESDKCHAALIFGDHGMTEDGNHGGGTVEETSAALFVHTSPACGDMSSSDSTRLLERQTQSEWVPGTFSSIHQIDLVPTISVMLGLPIPYANLGSLVPSLLPGLDIRQMSASLALNAAQVWRYLTVYSATANKLPDLSQLEERLQLATRVYKDALADSQSPDNDKYVQASSLYKLFLTEALELGQRVWTRFDIVGMVLGIIVLSVGLILYMLPLLSGWIHQPSRLPLSQHWEVATAGLFMLYQCGLLTFSNSYILEEEDSVMYSLAVLSCVVALRLKSDPVKSTLWRDVLLLPLASRINELFVSGHGLDPSIRLHWAHSSVLFLTSLFSLGVFRWYLYQNCITQSKWHAIADCTTLFCLAISWWEKRSLNAERNGFASMRVALALLFIGVLVSLLQAVSKDSDPQRRDTHALVRHVDSDTISAFAKFLGAIMAVTGPSTSTSLVLYIFQVAVVYCLSVTSGPLQVHSVVLAALLRLVTRHVFFATNHGCTFSRLQVSAAFVATKEFYFATSGLQLFLNTFGWEMAGIILAWLCSQHSGRSNVWKMYGMYQIVEALTSCISVSLLRRHLMVWDVYAPHFCFVFIFTILNLLAQLTVSILREF